MEVNVIRFSSSSIVQTQEHTRVTGYSWKTNQYGLTVDTVTAFELVLPNGEVAVVTEKDEDLWFALKVCLYGGQLGGAMSLRFVLQGGFNNYVNFQKGHYEDE